LKSLVHVISVYVRLGQVVKVNSVSALDTLCQVMSC